MYYRRPTSRSCLRINEAQAPAWRCSVSPRGCLHHRPDSVCGLKSRAPGVPTALLTAPAPGRPARYRQGHVRSSEAGKRRTPRRTRRRLARRAPARTVWARAARTS